MVYTVYLDEVLLGNVLMNFAILWFTARFALVPTTFRRLLSAAALGAAYAVVLFFPVPAWVAGIPAKVGVSLLMLAAAFYPQPVRKLGACFAIFYLASFGLGGLVFGLTYFLGSGGLSGPSGFLEVPRGYFWPAVVTALAVVWLVGRTGGAFLKRRRLKGLFHIPVRIHTCGRSLSVNALLDTGNQLSDPLTNHPVLVVEFNAVRELLPAELCSAFEAGEEPDFAKVLESLGNSRWAGRLRVIPFQSLGRSSGLLLGFRPDEVEILYGSENIRVRKVVVGVYQRQLCPEATYRALVNPRLLETAAGL
ncbi:sigma-E processing peptidase SpoIIGA [Candidatus Desulforudis audaxviator]|uniref:Sporulation sigma-E factor-processing peptidase n=1 Tax=Desulforudis audaxviator (strain MP104C) TaxID=477974 RepID=B1I4E2_DESAP|nr:sigma-E processing peptidase SpoIIGA [Candidatus Desulforudis audaxviator]ACA59934.1 peptidase U4, sporulation factor SpoIIGA [Candidatus Desulforudis audaxviator MP104C]AZK59948.1 Sporulation sigma-E factor processing peptidase (SpoIIGA) [Candidatus Desulforudis audaxviator]